MDGVFTRDSVVCAVNSRERQYFRNRFQTEIQRNYKYTMSCHVYSYTKCIFPLIALLAGCIDPVREGWSEGIPEAVQRPFQALRAAKTCRTSAGYSARTQVPAEDHLRVLGDGDSERRVPLQTTTTTTIISSSHRNDNCNNHYRPTCLVYTKPPIYYIPETRTAQPQP